MTKQPSARKRGRPRSPLTAIVPRIRCDPKELKQWESRARASGRTFGSWARWALNGAMTRMPHDDER